MNEMPRVLDVCPIQLSKDIIWQNISSLVDIFQDNVFPAVCTLIVNLQQEIKKPNSTHGSEACTKEL